MKVKECPSRKNCFDYKDNNCDNCDFGNEFTKLHKRIDRLKKQNETLTIQRNAWYLTAERVGEDLQKAKAEVAREIFEDIRREAIISKACAKRGIVYSVPLEEIEKKYTGVE